MIYLIELHNATKEEYLEDFLNDNQIEFKKENEEKCFYCRNNVKRLIEAGNIVCPNCKRELLTTEA